MDTLILTLVLISIISNCFLIKYIYSYRKLSKLHLELQSDNDINVVLMDMLIREIGLLLKYTNGNDTIKRCPADTCDGRLVSLASMNIKVCGGCHKSFPWNLEPGQRSNTIEGLNYENQQRD